jgi:hypothetical protein
LFLARNGFWQGAYGVGLRVLLRRLVCVTDTLVALKNGPAAVQKQKQQQQQQEKVRLAQLSDVVGIQDAIWSVLQRNASGDGQALLGSRELIREVG